MIFRAAFCGLAFVVLSGCPGKECALDADCPGGYACSPEGACVSVTPDGGGGGGGDCPDTSVPSAPNVLKNPGAECGTTGWFAPVNGKSSVEVETVNPHTGSKALKITATSAGDAFVWNDAEITTGANETWCAQAWMRGGTASDGRIGLRHLPVGGSTGIDEAYSSPVTQDWAVVPPSKGLLKFTTSEPETLQLRIILQQAQAGDTLIVDDVQLWKSAGGACTER